MKKLSAALLLYLGLASAALAQVISMPPPAGVVVNGCVFTTSPPVLTTGQIGYVQCTSTGAMLVTGTGSGGTTPITGTTSNASSGVATSATNIPSVSYNYGFNGTTWDQLQVDASKNLKVVSVSPSTGGGFPNASTPTTATATGTTAATTATLAAVSAKFTYICGFTITSDATAALAGTATVTGVVGGTMSYIQNVGSATAAGVLSQNFNPCLQSSAVNTAIAVISVAAGTGGNTAVVAWGYQQ